MKRHEIDTPALIIDLNKMEANIRNLHGYVQDRGLNVRAHIKTHKIPAIAHMQLEAGSKGITAQKLGEAEIMADAGIKDIQLTYNIVGQRKLERLMRLAKRCNLSIAIDNAKVAKGISNAAQAEGVVIDALVELESSYLQRTGAGGVEELVELARQVDDMPGLHLRGLMIYPSSPKDAERIRQAIEGLQAAGLSTDIISGGGTPAAWQLEQVPGLTELRIGDYVFNCKDIIDEVGSQIATLDDCALLIASTVISRPTADRVIVDAGSKTIGCAGSYPMCAIVEFPDAVLYNMNEEHGYIDASASKAKPEIGDRVTIIPECCGGTVNLHDTAYAVRGDQVLAIWDIAGRGKSR